MQEIPATQIREEAEEEAVEDDGEETRELVPIRSLTDAKETFGGNPPLF